MEEVDVRNLEPVNPKGFVPEVQVAKTPMNKRLMET